MNPTASVRIGVVVIAALVPYARGLSNPWVWDDRVVLGKRLAPEHCSGLGAVWRQPYWGNVGLPDTYRPLSLSMIYLEERAFGNAVIPYHIVSRMLHLAVCLLIMRVFGRLAGKTVGWSCALLFAVHPVHAEAVAMVYGQLEMISAIFMLMAIGFYVDSLKHSFRPVLFAMAVVSGACAACSKESGLMLPALLILVRATWMVGDGDLRARTRIFFQGIGKDSLFIVAAVPYLFLRYQALGGLTPAPEATVTLGYTFGMRTGRLRLEVVCLKGFTLIRTRIIGHFGPVRSRKSLICMRFRSCNRPGYED